jgi:hypothetical protein
VVVAHFKALLWHSPEENEKNHVVSGELEARADTLKHMSRQLWVHQPARRPLILWLRNNKETVEIQRGMTSLVSSSLTPFFFVSLTLLM